MCSCLLLLIQPLSLLPACLCSPSSHLFSLFLLTLPTVSPSPSLCSSVILPRLFYLLRSFFFPICFLFCSISSAALLCFSSSDPALEHLREIRRKLASENLQLKAPVASFALQISAQHSETFRPSSSLSGKQVVSHSACLDSLFDASISSELPQPPAPNLPNQRLFPWLHSFIIYLLIVHPQFYLFWWLTHLHLCW